MSILPVQQNVAGSPAPCARGYVLENGAVDLEGKGTNLLRNDDARRACLGI